MQISYPIDEPSGLLPIDVDPPFDGEPDTGAISKSNSKRILEDVDIIEACLENASLKTSSLLKFNVWNE